MNSAKIPANPPPSNFPSDVLRWMKKNSPSPGMSLKLMKICKYFQLTDLTDFKAHVPVKGVYTVKRSDHLWYETIRHKNKRVNHQHIEFKLVHYKTYNIEDVQQYVDKLIKKDVPDYPAPIIYFPGQKKNLSLIRKKYCKFNMP
uniref:Uncharacterized protein n=1 Tax=Panagrolaimus davidi TaxID=227884 RepID=A0A914PXY2_9BILA